MEIVSKLYLLLSLGLEWGYEEGIHHMSLIPRPIEASDVGSHVKSTPECPDGFWKLTSH
ncbi:hypothetical protein [Desulfosporosinus nitroreducens]|uniref:hypothetical protein n=1 Tax=Desulfosporosinus nitroreducens TaxID=2018668 RepID=UPI00207CA22C|nr:hypothetical protein [Desulfosporosinus nitroreducens]MCO1602717.1 hypothetical protein [Desulfosporosinus nitroreducens]